MQYVGGEKLAGKKALAPAVNLSGLPDGTTCSLAKRSASEGIAEPVAERVQEYVASLSEARARR